MSYTELYCKTNFSFLTGASHADELVTRAAELGYSTLAITDENTLAGVVRAYTAIRDHYRAAEDDVQQLKLIIGAEIVPCDAPPVVLWATDRQAYARLSRLITVGRRRAIKGECWLTFDDIAAHHQGLIAGVVPSLAGDAAKMDHLQPGDKSFEWFTDVKRFRSVADYREVFDDRANLIAALYQGVDDAWRAEQLQRLSNETGMPLVAGGDVLYHSPARLPLHDVLTAIRHRTTVPEAGSLLVPNADRHLHPVEARRRQFTAVPGAIERASDIASACSFCLSQLRYEYPDELAPPGKTQMEYLRSLVAEGAAERYPGGTSEKVRRQLEHELALIDELDYAAYFLTVQDLVRFARQRDILCQGRGSAANSAVCYVLGVTSVDPATSDLLFERFISKERDEAPDIDVDFEHERREEVLQYLFEKYGRHRAGLAATVVTYRSRSAIRDVGKALGMSADRVDALARQVDGYSNVSDLGERCRAVGIDPDSGIGAKVCYLTREILGFPRHLSQHVGGMVMTEGRLDELVPVENASMDDRTVIQWDKNDLESLGLLKVDCLCLGMLTAIRKCFSLVRDHYGVNLTLANIPQDDAPVYDMICAADTIGVFQIESRGQMNMLPRLKPRCYYDLVIEVSIVRPGPIQGNMVHPFLRRRSGKEQPVYPNAAIKAVLERTLGVPIFQEQAMQLAVVAAGFTPGEADQLRRAMGAWRRSGVIEEFRQKLMDGMRKNGLEGEFADQVFNQIRGFGEYGFPESHAASFALLVYVSSYLKCYYPAAFCVSLLNSQPMGFYPPAQLIADAQRHDIGLLPVDVNHSDHDSALETVAGSDELAIRMGLRMISGVRADDIVAIIAARDDGGPFTSVADLTRRARLGQATIAVLSSADAFGSLKQDRREALWQALAQERRPLDQPLFGSLDADDDDCADYLPTLTPQQQVTADYQTLGLSLRAHPVSFYRQRLTEAGVRTHASLADGRHNQYVRVAGLVVLRQRPATAKGITFVTLEDETGVANLVVRPNVWERFRGVVRGSVAWQVTGKLEKHSGVINIVVSRIEDLSPQFDDVQVKSRNFH